jgi:hypothetical protein
MAVWPEYVTDILGNDRCVALAYRTPAAGVALTPVVTLGAFDSDAATVTTTTSFGAWRKLVRLQADERAALVYHTRHLSDVDHPHLLVVQGRATFPDVPGGWLPPELEARYDEFMHARRRGRFRDWIGHEYYEYRVPVTIAVERILAFDRDDRAEPSEVLGAAVTAPPEPQEPPAKGTAPRVAHRRWGSRFERARHHLVGYTDADGFPMAHRVEPRVEGDALRFECPALPAGGRRAGFLSHWFEHHMVGQGSDVFTGWLEVDDSGAARYAPHTVGGYAVPATDLAFELGSGLTMKFGYRRAVKRGLVRDGVWQRTRT